MVLFNKETAHKEEEEEAPMSENKLQVDIVEEELSRWTLEDRDMDMQLEAVQRSANEAQASKKLQGLEGSRIRQQRDSNIKLGDHCLLDGGSALQPHVVDVHLGA